MLGDNKPAETCTWWMAFWAHSPPFPEREKNKMMEKNQKCDFIFEGLTNAYECRKCLATKKAPSALDEAFCMGCNCRIKGNKGRNGGKSGNCNRALMDEYGSFLLFCVYRLKAQAYSKLEVAYIVAHRDASPVALLA